jgi:hypothetical protein
MSNFSQKPVAIKTFRALMVLGMTEASFLDTAHTETKAWKFQKFEGDFCS